MVGLKSIITAGEVILLLGSALLNLLSILQKKEHSIWSPKEGGQLLAFWLWAWYSISELWFVICYYRVIMITDTIQGCCGCEDWLRRYAECRKWQNWEGFSNFRSFLSQSLSVPFQVTWHLRFRAYPGPEWAWYNLDFFPFTYLCAHRCACGVKERESRDSKSRPWLWNWTLQ